MAVVNKFNVNNKQVTLDSDIIENMSANDVPYDSSFQYNKNTVGDKLSELESKIGEENKHYSNGTTAGVPYDYPIVVGKTYRIKNEGNTALNLFTMDKYLQVIETIASPLHAGSNILFTAEENAHYLFCYYLSDNGGAFSIIEKDTIKENVLYLSQEISDIKENYIPSVDREIENLNDWVDNGIRTIDVSKCIIERDGEYITNTGSYVTNSAYNVYRYDIPSSVDSFYCIQESSIELNGILVLDDGTKLPLSSYITESNAYTFKKNNGGAYLLINNTISNDKGIVEVYIIRDVIPDNNIKYTFTTIVNKPYSFNGKSAIFFGDSITQNVYSEENGTTRFDPSVVYSKLFANKVGISNFSNQAMGGSSFTNGVGQVNSIHDTILSKSTVGNFDYIFVSGGTNDYEYGAVIGTISDTQPTTFYGALNSIASYLLSKTTADKIVFILPINRFKSATNKVADLNEYRQAIFDVCFINGFSVINGENFGFPEAESVIAHKFIGDGLHPTLIGHQMMAKSLLTHLV